MELSVYTTIFEGFLYGVLVVLGVALIYCGALVITSAVKQIPLKTLSNKVLGYTAGLGVLSFLIVGLGVLLGATVVFLDRQVVEIEQRYGLELTRGQVERLNWPKENPANTTVYGDLRLDDNRSVTLLWDDGVYRLALSETLVYEEIPLQD